MKHTIIYACGVLTGVMIITLYTSISLTNARPTHKINGTGKSSSVGLQENFLQLAINNWTGQLTKLDLEKTILSEDSIDAKLLPWPVGRPGPDIITVHLPVISNTGDTAHLVLSARFGDKTGISTDYFFQKIENKWVITSDKKTIACGF